MTRAELLELLAAEPVIAAVRDDKWQAACESPARILFYLKASLLTAEERIARAVEAGKLVFVHMDLAEGVAKDRAGVDFFARCGAAGILSTGRQQVAYAKERGLLAVHRVFALDSRGLSSIRDMCAQSAADVFEIMPGVIGKVIERFSQAGLPVIAGGLIETKAEVTAALQSGALAVSTGREELWYS